jgi:integrase
VLDPAIAQVDSTTHFAPDEVHRFNRTLTLADGTVRTAPDTEYADLTLAMRRGPAGAFSPVVRIVLPRVERPRVVPLTVEQVAALADAMPGRFRSMVITQVGLGLRIGELLGLRVGDVDFLRRTVRVEWQFTSGSKERSEPKTPRSRRTIPARRWSSTR